MTVGSVVCTNLATGSSVYGIDKATVGCTASCMHCGLELLYALACCSMRSKSIHFIPEHEPGAEVGMLQVYFRAIPETVIDQLLEEGIVMGCAGGLMIEHPLVTPLIAKMEGTEDSIKGLSKQLTLELLVKANTS